LLALLPLIVQAAAPAASAAGPAYANLQGSVLLENARVRVEKLVLAPGQSTGQHTHPADQLLVFVHGGVLQSNDTHRSTRWRDGRVVWSNAHDRPDAGSRNTGDAPIEMILVTVKPLATAAAPSRDDGTADPHLDYPNIPGEDLLENDRVIVQRFIVAPGQWEGVHAHRPNMLYIHIKGGQWAARTYQQPPHPYPAASADGSVGWMPTIDISEGHQSGNIGTEPIDLIWVTLRGE
jgi:beta-alanine degradation protein BauB